MSVRIYRRLTRYAALSVASVVASFVIPQVAPWSSARLVGIMIAWLPVFLAWGPFQADVAMNPALDEIARKWWRIALFLVPGALALYWHQHVRGTLVD